MFRKLVSVHLHYLDRLFLRDVRGFVERDGNLFAVEGEGDLPAIVHRQGLVALGSVVELRSSFFVDGGQRGLASEFGPLLFGSGFRLVLKTEQRGGACYGAHAVSRLACVSPQATHSILDK